MAATAYFLFTNAVQVQRNADLTNNEDVLDSSLWIAMMGSMERWPGPLGYPSNPSLYLSASISLPVPLFCWGKKYVLNSLASRR